jgi:hypothetical protein
MKILNSGDKMNENKWKGVLVVLALFLLPLPTTPLFFVLVSQIKPIYIILLFIGNLQVMPLSLHI